jgi:hypothetical protein
MTDTPLKVPIDPPLQEILRLSAQLRLSTIPNSKKRATREVLEKRLTAWYEGLVPGRMVRFKQRKARGAPRKYLYDEQEWSYTNDYFNMREQLRRQSEETFNRKKGETDAGLTIRMAKVIQQLHLNSLHCLESYQLRGDNWTMVEKPMSLALAKGIAAPAAQRSKRRVSKDVLAYGLLAHYTGLTPKALQGIVERTETTSPDYAEFRKRRNALKDF